MGPLIPRCFVGKFQNSKDEEKILKPPERKEKKKSGHIRKIRKLPGIKFLLSCLRNLISQAPPK